MLEHLGLEAEANRIIHAVETVCAQGVLTPDVGGNATTREVADAVLDAIRKANI